MFTKVRENRIYQNIVDQILEAIFRGELKANDKLPSENELARIFGVSRVTVREAIRSLEQSGVLEVRQGSLGGAYIKEIDLDSIASQIESALRMVHVTIYQLGDARAALEDIIFTKLIPSKISAEDCKDLEDNIATAEAYFRDNEEVERLLTNFRFHTMIAEITANPIIILMHKLIMDLLFGFFENVRASTAMARKSLEDHKKMVELFRLRRFEEAKEICFHHIQEVIELIAKKSKQQSLLGKGT
jgi:DNA-binding FadR family transcriptional regulator